MIANEHHYNEIPGIVVKNPAKALSQELLMRQPILFHGKK